MRHLEDNKTNRIQWENQEAKEKRLEDYIVRSLMEIDAIDYDEHADLLYQLAFQVVVRIKIT